MERILEVQKKIGVLGKDSKNPFFKSAYLDLNKLLIHVTPLLIENGLLLSQPIQDGLVKSLIIDAESGEVLLNSEIALPDIKDPQKLGSAITYYRRYTLKSLLSIAEGDDDGNLASKPEPKIDLNLDKLKKCKTLQELQDFYMNLEGAEKIRLEKAKNDKKQELK